MLLHERIVFRTADQLLRSHLSRTFKISMMAPWSLILFEFLEKKSVKENSLEEVFSSMSKSVGILWIFKHIDFLLCCKSSLETITNITTTVYVYNRINLSLCCLPDAVFPLGRENSFIQHNYEVTSKQKQNIYGADFDFCVFYSLGSTWKYRKVPITYGDSTVFPWIIASRGPSLEGVDYFKYCLLEVVPYIFCFIIPWNNKKNNLIK